MPLTYTYKININFVNVAGLAEMRRRPDFFRFARRHFLFKALKQAGVADKTLFLMKKVDSSFLFRSEDLRKDFGKHVAFLNPDINWNKNKVGRSQFFSKPVLKE